MPDAKYGAFLRERRLARGLSQRDLAGKVGVDYTYVSKVENQRLPAPSEATITHLAKVLGDNPEDHLARAQKMPLDLRSNLARYPIEATMLVRKVASQPYPSSLYRQMLSELEAAAKKSSRARSAKGKR
jgi:HTH-type transcriptional regulator, competence development regulator